MTFTARNRTWCRGMAVDGVANKRLRRGVFTSVADLTAAITGWAEHWNTDPKPFIWKATAQQIIEKVSRGRATLH